MYPPLCERGQGDTEVKVEAYISVLVSHTASRLRRESKGSVTPDTGDSLPRGREYVSLPVMLITRTDSEPFWLLAAV